MPGTIRLVVTEDYDSLSGAGAAMLADFIVARPDATVVAATGDTPMGIYAELAGRRVRGELDASRLRVFQLDEYLGIGADDPRSLYGWLLRSFVRPLGIPETNVVRLRGDVEDVEAACAAYERAVEEADGFDLAILGLGPNGHLGFNEPPSEPGAPTRVVELTEASIESNARYWGGRQQVPRGAVTAGMSSLLSSRQVLLVVSGAHKSDILRRTLTGPPTPEVPSSLLQQAADVTVLADRAAWPFGPLHS
jgi:glucosamine-6-phosphate deaminase